MNRWSAAATLAALLIPLGTYGQTATPGQQQATRQVTREAPPQDRPCSPWPACLMTSPDLPFTPGGPGGGIVSRGLPPDRTADPGRAPATRGGNLRLPAP